ncbi:MAG: ABC transporter ATP-binding protein, partial [Alphaproteobacteria bacterium]|nr:ABC transporter ATP-binding protein [Alphaproteobacteria bacterium]
MSALLTLNNVETFYGLTRALAGVSLEVEAGRIVAVLGANGAGKTTILRTIMGLIEDQPDKGRVEFEGRRIDGWETEDIARLGIAYVPEGREVFEELSVVENLLMGAYPRRDRAAVAADMDDVMARFPRLAERRDQWAGTLSGGEQQMLAIGRALMARPKLILLDEPSLGLSPLLVREIFEIIRAVNAAGTTILLVEQNAKMALAVADYGLVLEGGRFVLAGTPDELSADEDIREFYLGLESEVSVKGYQRYRRKKRWH